MKINKFLIIIALVAIVKVNGQVRIVNSVTNTTALNSSAFIDASSNSSNNASTNVGKGLLFPRVDLTTFASFSGSSIGLATSYPTRYDGLVVYNTGTGNTLVGASTNIVAVSPGFYYYNNRTATSVLEGTWTPLASGSVTKDVTSTEVALSTKVNGEQLYAINGTFTASGSSTAVSITKPTGMTGYYSMVTYKEGKTFRRDIYSFDTLSTTNNVICGTGAYSEILPAGTYNYVLEYFK
jgi:hypothetical protein